ncbi:hypothetical protein KCU65_g2943, partial [Aureobasidium melanogenum]
MTNWSDCPTEIKQMVANEVDLDGYDLLDFRLVEKECNKLSKNRFAETYFTTRRHFVGKKSFQALVDISRHEFFGPYVKTVQLSAIQGDYELCHSEERHPGTVGYHTTFNEYWHRAELKSLLRQAFINLKAYGEPLTIGIDRYWRPFDDDMPYACYGRIAMSSWQPGKLYNKSAEWADVTENESIAFNMITSIAKEVELPVKRLKVSLYDHYMMLEEEGEDYWDFRYSEPPKEPCNLDLVSDIYQYLEKSPELDVDIDLTTGDGRYADHPYQSMKVNYDSKSKKLSIEKTDPQDVYEFMLPWLSAIQLRSLCLVNMNLRHAFYLDMLTKDRASTIKRLRMRNCDFKNDWQWNHAIVCISSLPALEYLSFTDSSVENNWDYFFNFFFFGSDKKLIFTGDVQEQLLVKLEKYDEVAVEDPGEYGENEDEDEEDDEEDDEESDEDEEDEDENEDDDGENEDDEDDVEEELE